MSNWSMSPGNFAFVFRSGFRAQVTPEGDCRECTFTAKGSGIGLHPLDAVTISWEGQPIFYGEVRVGGNPYDVNGHQFTLRSLALRLKEVTIPDGWSAPQQNAGKTVRSMIEAVLPQLGGAFTVGAIDLPFDCRAVKNAQQQNPYALLEQIASDGAGMGVKVRFGVNANHQFFCVPANEGDASLSNDMMTGQTHWVAPVAETPVTAVLWYVCKKQDGSWLTHKSIAPEASVYGMRTKAVSLTSDAGLWILVSGTYYALMDDASGAWHSYPQDAAAVTLLTDGINSHDSVGVANGGPTNTNSSSDGSGNGGRGRFGFVPHAPVTRYTLAASLQGKGGLFADTQQSPSGPMLASIYTLWGDSSLNATYYPVGSRVTDSFVISTASTSLDANGKPEAIALSVYELRPEVLNTDLLDRLACYHYNIPATAPADIEVRGFLPPTAGRVTYDGWQSPVDCYEYRLTAQRGMNTGILAGQADDPAKLAQAALIKARDQHAVITAITSNQ